MKLDTKSKKRIKKKSKNRIFFRKKKLQKKLNFFCWKNEKNNAEKRAFFLTKKHEIAKHEKSKKLNFFVPIVCTPKFFRRQLFDVMLFSKKFSVIF